MDEVREGREERSVRERLAELPQFGLAADDLAILRTGRMVAPAEVATRSHAALLRIEQLQARQLEVLEDQLKVLADIRDRLAGTSPKPKESEKPKPKESEKPPAKED